ncbi:hypothetical protein JCM10908_001899 [Rhodotorula pacifica]|uniref:uncharacterized protein n=1 Tax=Rhodotorula pacifica TaxID=1495444 RepID=UPI00316F977A
MEQRYPFEALRRYFDTEHARQTVWGRVYGIASGIHDLVAYEEDLPNEGEGMVVLWANTFIGAFRALYLNIILPMFDKAEALVAYLGRMEQLMRQERTSEKLRSLEFLRLPSFLLDPPDTPREVWGVLRDCIANTPASVIRRRRAPPTGSPAREAYDKIQVWANGSAFYLQPFESAGYAKLSHRLLKFHRHLADAATSVGASHYRNGCLLVVRATGFHAFN